MSSSPRSGAELRLANGVTLLGKFDGEFANLADRMPLVGIPALALGVAITLSASQPAALCLGRNHD